MARPGHVVEVEQQVLQRDIASERRHVDMLVEIRGKLGVGGGRHPVDQVDDRLQILTALPVELVEVVLVGGRVLALVGEAVGAQQLAEHPVAQLVGVGMLVTPLR